MPAANDREKRQSIIDACLRMNALGINQGTSGNISLRHHDGMLVTPTSVPYETMQPEQIVFIGPAAMMEDEQTFGSACGRSFAEGQAAHQSR